MAEFVLNSEFSPKGDQGKAIDALTAGLRKGLKHQVLLGVTGSGKTFTMANVIARVQKPTLVVVHNKTLAAQLYQEFKLFSPTMRSNILSVITTTISLRPTFPRRTRTSPKMLPSTTRSTRCVMRRRRRCWSGMTLSWWLPSPAFTA